MKGKLEVMTVKMLREYLEEVVSKGIVKENETVYLATDEEGNGLSPLTLEGMKICVEGPTFYPLMVK